MNGCGRSRQRRLPDNEVHGRAAGVGVGPTRHPPGQVTIPARQTGMTHGQGHLFRIPGMGHGRIEQDSIHAKFHGDGHIGRTAHSRIDDYGDSSFLEDDTDIVGIEYAKSGPYGRTERHDGVNSSLAQAPRHHGVIAAVGHDNEPIRDQFLAGHEGLKWVWQEGLFVGQNFHLYDLPDSQFPGHMANLNGVLGIEAGRRVGQKCESVSVDEIQERGLAPAVSSQVNPAQGHGDQVGPAGLMAALHGEEVRVLARANNQP